MNVENTHYNKFTSNFESDLKNNEAEYKEKAGHIDLSQISAKKTLDSFEKGGSINEMLYEMYPQYQVTKKMPKSVFGDQFGYDMQKEISTYLSDFYAGKISQNEVEKFFEASCTSMQIYRKQQHQTSGSDVADKQQIISEMYEVFAKENMRAARNANAKEGEGFNRTSYGSRNDDWVYYNSDFYYQCENMREVLQKSMDGMTDKWEISAIDAEEIEKNSSFTLDGGFDFNSGWNFSFRNQRGRASMEDESLVPPPNFKFFYKENLFPDNEGVLWGALNEQEFSAKIPFSTSRSGSLEGQIFYVGNLLDDIFKTGNKESKQFLNNFAVFTRWYSWQSGINNVFGSFVSPKR